MLWGRQPLSRGQGLCQAMEDGNVGDQSSCGHRKKTTQLDWSTISVDHHAPRGDAITAGGPVSFQMWRPAGKETLARFRASTAARTTQVIPIYTREQYSEGQRNLHDS